MGHVHESAFLDLLEGRGSSHQRKHLEECSECRAELAEWQALLEDLDAAGNLALESSELNRLGALFRALGPLRDDCREWIARLLSSPVPATGPIPARMTGYSIPIRSHSSVRRVGRDIGLSWLDVDSSRH